MKRIPKWLRARAKSGGAMAGAGLVVGLISSAFFGDLAFGALAGLGIGFLIGFGLPPLFEKPR
jgi:hypothetical protein